MPDDFCARPRPSTGAYTLGALEHSLGDCDGGTSAPGDAGTGPDAGTVDGGAEGGGDSGPQDEVKGGCSCGTAPGLTAILLALLLPLVLRRRAPGE